MLLVISPAKKLDFDTSAPTASTSEIAFQKETAYLAKAMKEYSAPQLAKLMSISKDLSELNRDRYQYFKPNSYVVDQNAKQAIFAFQGDVYKGMDANSFKAPEIKFAQKHLRILSGLYGIVRPCDLIQPYRLEMGIKLKTQKANNLHDYWSELVTKNINNELKKMKSKTLINLASNEYFKAINTNDIDGDILTIDFKQYKNGVYKTFGMLAKRARGMMSRYIITNKITDPEDIKAFNIDGYKFSKKDSSTTKYVFLKK